MNGRYIGMGLLPLFLICPLALPTDPGLLFPKAPITVARDIDRRGSTVPRYNFPPATRGDRFARRGLNLKVGVKGWKRYGGLIKKVAREQGIDPYVLGAYVWVESEFDARQDYIRGPRRAVGLGSVQAQDHRRYSIKQLMDPHFNLTLTASEFRSRWNPNDMFGTVMDVWYPAWRRLNARGQKIPVIKTPRIYVQAIANRFYALRDIDQRFKPTTNGNKDRRRPYPISCLP